MSIIKLLSPNALPARNDRGALTSTVIVLCLLVIMGIAGHTSAREAKYTIRTNSPESWSDYFTRTGLGAVDAMPLPVALESPLNDHCRWLTEHTDYDWIPLGYSVELGYKLCYRTGPFSAVDAEAYCGRLDMGVMENSRLFIVCGGKWVQPQVPVGPIYEAAQ